MLTEMLTRNSARLYKTCTKLLFWFSVTFTILVDYRISVKGIFILERLECAQKRRPWSERSGAAQLAELRAEG